MPNDSKHVYCFHIKLSAGGRWLAARTFSLALGLAACGVASAGTLVEGSSSFSLARAAGALAWSFSGQLATDVSGAVQYTAIVE